MVSLDAIQDPVSLQEPIYNEGSESIYIMDQVKDSKNSDENWAENMDEDNALKYNHALTNRLNLLIMAVDGITDRKYINDFIKRMNVRDSAALRKYMNQNEPGVDYNITIEKPASLGGGSIETFLQLDQFLFLNIAD